MELRPARTADLPALFDIFNAAIDEVYRRHAFDPPAPPQAAFVNQHAHLLERDGDSVVVAEDANGPLGFGAAWTRGDAWFLASLFVRPEAQGRAVGSALLDAVAPTGAARRLTITDAIQPVSNALYVRRGLVPTTPVLSFGGTPRIEAPRSLRAAPTARPDDLARVDGAAYGFDRAVDHAYWERHAERHAWAREGEIVAWSYVFPGGTIGPVAGIDPDAAAEVVAAELARAVAGARVRAPGTSRRIVETAVSAGLRLTPTPGLLLLSEGVQAPTSLAIGSYTLL